MKTLHKTLPALALTTLTALLGACAGTPMATMAPMSAGCAPCGARTVKVALRRARSICTVTWA